MTGKCIEDERWREDEGWEEYKRYKKKMTKSRLEDKMTEGECKRGETREEMVINELKQ